MLGLLKKKGSLRKFDSLQQFPYLGANIHNLKEYIFLVGGSVKDTFEIRALKVFYDMLEDLEDNRGIKRNFSANRTQRLKFLEKLIAMPLEEIPKWMYSGSGGTQIICKWRLQGYTIILPKEVASA